jgi:phosphoribosylanthranilate isomerase
MKPTATKATYEDCEEILALQKRAFLSEAAIYDDLTIPPLTQTLSELQADFFKKTILKVVLDNQIVGTIRASSEAGVVHIERVMVHPDYQKRGLGNILMKNIESHFADANLYELFTGCKSFSNIHWYQKSGYKIVGEDKVISPKLTITRMIKNRPNLLKIKVCGMRETENINLLAQLPIDYMGFIFYEKSARYVQSIPDLTTFEKLSNLKKVGVFVNAETDFVLEKVEEFGLNVVQLHGKETPQYLRDLRVKYLRSKVTKLKHYQSLVTHQVSIMRNEPTESNKLDVYLDAAENDLNKIRATYKIEIWKAFSVDDASNFDVTKPYEAFADKFLFDTKTPLHGGSGQKFDWEILKNYHGQTPFFLSGGISAADTEGVKNIQHPQFYGVDVNSKFEISPALKDVPMLQKFINDLRF